MRTPAALLAHQGGWDEILMVVGPLLLVVGLLYWARSRQGARTETDRTSN